MTTLTYLGHACFLFETDQAACLIDPWLSSKGAFLGAWRQLPPNQGALTTALNVLKAKPTMIYLTHEHEDHYDEETLKILLPHAASLVIPRYENHFLKNLIESNLHITPLQVAENTPQSFHTLTYRIFIDESGINRDSAIFLSTKELAFLNVNDCKIYDRAAWIREQCGPIDVLSCQFSGANMHPICYDVPPETMAKISRQKRLRKYIAVRDFIKALQPGAYVPSAGPALFTRPEHSALNFAAETIFPRWWDFAAYLQDKNIATPFIPLDIGGSIRKENEVLNAHGLAEPLSDAHVQEMLAMYQQGDDASPAASLAENVVLTFFEKEMAAKAAVLAQHPKTQFEGPLYVEITSENGSSHWYTLRTHPVSFAKIDSPQLQAPYYLHRTSIAALGRLLQSGKGWGTYFLSFQFTNRRDPDVFDTVLATTLVANDAAELDFGLRKLVEFRESEQFITLTAQNGTEVTCRRYCPHQGADLTYAKFDGRYVTCPRHQWKFDCENGGKADNSSDSIEACLKVQA